MKPTFLLLCYLMLPFIGNSQIFPPTSCYNNDFQLELSVTGNQSTCNDSFLLSTTFTGSPLVYWTDGYIGDSRWVTYPGYYQAYAFDSFGCADTTEGITVDVNTNYAVAASATFLYTFCEGDSLLLNGFASGIPQWNDGQTGTTVYVKNPGFYSFTAIDPNGCTVSSNVLEVIQLQLPQITLSTAGDAVLCMGDSITVTATASGIVNWAGAWGSGNTVTLNQTGEYYAYGFDSTGQCIGYSDTINLTIREPYAENLCYVTVDSATGKNMLIWNNTPDHGTASYNIYTESNIFDQYILLGNVPFGTGSYIHLSSIPEQQPYRYYIAAIDTCGNENATAMYYLHGTIHLTSSLGVNGQNNLLWSSYFGNFPVLSYDIYRSNNFGPFTSIATISAAFNSFSDLTPPAGNNRYYVGIQNAPCGTINSSIARSNTVSNQATTGISEIGNATLTVTGDPGSGIFEISGLQSMTGTQLTIHDQSGRMIATMAIQNDRETINLSTAAAGVYFLQAGGKAIKIIR